MLQNHLDPDVNVGFSTMHVFPCADIMTWKEWINFLQIHSMQKNRVDMVFMLHFVW